MLEGPLKVSRRGRMPPRQSATSAFLLERKGVQRTMGNSNSTMAEQVAQAARAMQQQRTGRAPKSITVVLAENIVVVSLHEALSPAEMSLAQTPDGAAQLQEFHRQLFLHSCDSLCQEIQRITGVEVREASTTVGTAAAEQAFATGTLVQIFVLAGTVPTDTFSDRGEFN
jgi:uncharacterized protein YbcI